MTHVLYLTFDLNDAATWRRVAMLRLGGAYVTLAGFHRSDPPQSTPETPVIPLGQTYNARMGQRLLAVAKAFLKLRASLTNVPKPDVILARNLETLLLAPRIRRLYGSERPALAYECLDIHRMMLGDEIKARALRLIERALLRQADQILTSSPAFVRNYFEPLSRTETPLRIIENRTLPGLPPAQPPAQPAHGQPFRIGWFGVLRCQTSLHCLDAFTRAAPGRYQVVLRGKPARDAVPDFDEVVASNPDLTFEGPYRGTEDLPRIYGEVHFAWLIDRFEAGQNSEWLLPNRLYEGGAFAAVPIALDGTETAAFLKRHRLGLSVREATADALQAALSDLRPERWGALSDAMKAEPRETWCFSEHECIDLVHDLSRGSAGPAVNQTRPGKEAVS